MFFVEIAGRDELFFDSFHRIEHDVLEEFLPHIVPDILLWVELRAFGRQFYDAHMLWNIKHSRAMAGRAVIDEKQEIIGETGGEFLQKDVHAWSVHGGQDEVATVTVKGADRAVRIGIFTHDLFADNGAHTRRCPASAGIVDPPEASLILEENLQLFAFGFFPCFFDNPWPVFLKAACAASSVPGCFGRGAIFRQP